MHAETLSTRVAYRLPDELRLACETRWSAARGDGNLHSFLEGPAFDRAGTLYCTDVCHGRIFRIDAGGTWRVLAHYDGQPNGMKVHPDGRLFVADAARGLLILHPATGDLLAEHAGFGAVEFQGLNDLFFRTDGSLLLTDPGPSSLANPCGRVFSLGPDGTLTLLIEALAFPNGVAAAPDDKALCIAVTRTLQVLRAQCQGGRLHNPGVFLSLSGGLAGPDGIAFLEDGSLIVAHSGLGVVWLFTPLGELRARIQSCAGIRTTNVAVHPHDRRKLFITESESGCILLADLPAPGALLPSLAI